MSVVPDSGAGEGGESVTINGLDFTPDAIVYLSGVEQPTTYVSDIELTIITVPFPAGGVVSVSVAQCTGSDTLPAAFTYAVAVGPNLISIAPVEGPEPGGTFITLTGTGFAADITIQFDGVTAVSIAFFDSTTVTCDTPAGTGTVDVFVSQSTGTDTLTNGYEYLTVPDLVSIAPVEGFEPGGTSVTLTGTGFRPDSLGVTFGGIAATGVVFFDSTTVFCVTPAGTGIVDVVLSQDSGSDTLTNGYSYILAPTLVSIVPAEGPEAGATAFTLTGTDFRAGSLAVTLGGVAATSVVFVNSTSVTGVTGDYSGSMPASGFDDVDVVITQDSGSDTLTNGFRYQPAPAIRTGGNGVLPNPVSACGGQVVTITGTDFTVANNMQVFIDGVLITHVYIDTNTLTIVMPTYPEIEDDKDVTVTNDWGTDTLVDGLTVTWTGFESHQTVLVDTGTLWAGNVQKIAAFALYTTTGGGTARVRLWMTDGMIQDTISTIAGVQASIDSGCIPLLYLSEPVLDASTLWIVEQHVTCLKQVFKSKSRCNIQLNGGWVFRLRKAYNKVLSDLTT